MPLQQRVSLKPFNTFGVPAEARWFLHSDSVEEIIAMLADAKLRRQLRLLLGGGSNILFVEDWPGLVIQYERRGIDIVGEDDSHVFIRAAAGEPWHDFVRATIDMGYAGLENLSLIPGTVGAAPVQNIGAYGVELAQRFHSLERVDLDSGERVVMSRDDCEFGYRDSWFKHQRPGRFLIASVTVALPKRPRWSLGYGDLAREVTARGGEVSAALISDVVCDIRRRKLPDPARIGNAGSFFKNPVVDAATAEGLQEKFPDLPCYPAPNGFFKLPAAWLIEQCGWKGHQRGDAAVSDDHALVLVNYGNATGAELWSLARAIINDVAGTFGVTLEPEPRIPGVNVTMT